MTGKDGGRSPHGSKSFNEKTGTQVEFLLWWFQLYPVHLYVREYADSVLLSLFLSVAG